MEDIGFAEPPDAAPLDAMNQKPVRRGSVAKAPDGATVLVNDRKQPFQVTDEVLSIWKMCDGTRSVDQMCALITSTAMAVGVDFEKVRGVVLEILGKLEGAGLVKG
ncbi:MAG: PqqD family protein [Halobacteria archaeon]